MKRILGAIAAGVIASMALTGAATAQKRVDAKKDWSIFEATESGKKICWIVSQPTNSSATRDGKSVNVRRGDIFLMVAVRPGDNASNEVSFLSGYPFRKGSQVKVTVGDKSHTMFTDNENAWTPSPKDDDALTRAFRAGSSARVEGVSGRGTTTVDTFSLAGFTAAIQSATSRCK